MKMKNKFKVFFISVVFSFLFFFIVNTIAIKFIGWKTKFTPLFHKPITWKEYFVELPNVLEESFVLSIISSVAFTIIFIEAKEKDLEATRKRIEEGEKNSRKENVRNGGAEVEIDGNENADR